MHGVAVDFYRKQNSRNNRKHYFMRKPHNSKRKLHNSKC